MMGGYGPTPEWTIACTRGMDHYGIPRRADNCGNSNAPYMTAEKTWEVKR